MYVVNYKVIIIINYKNSNYSWQSSGVTNEYNARQHKTLLKSMHMTYL